MFKIPKENLKYVFLVAGVIILISRSISLFINPVSTSVKPALSLINSIRREVGGIIFYHRNYLENESLHRDLDLLKSKLAGANELSLENQRLKNLLSFKQKSSLKLVAARVIARSPDNWSQAILIDRGRNNGIRLGMIVINYAGLLGRIIEVQDNMSRVVLISDPSLGVSALLQRSRQEGLVNGTLGENLIMRYLPEDADVVLNDDVITSELSQIYPKGLRVGKVIAIGKEFSGLNRYAVIKPAVDLENIEEVLVIIP